MCVCSTCDERAGRGVRVGAESDMHAEDVKKRTCMCACESQKKHTIGPYGI